MDLNNIILQFNGKFEYLEEIKNDLLKFPQNTFTPHGQPIPILEIKIRDKKDSITIQPYEEGKILSIALPEGVSETIIDHTNRSTNFKYNKKTYYIFAEKR